MPVMSLRLALIASFTIAVTSFTPWPAMADIEPGSGPCAPSQLKHSVQRQEDIKLGAVLKIPVYRWSNDNLTPKAVIVLIHGLIMHGGTFDSLAKHLVDDGCIVYAMDLRGHGRWYSNKESRIDYKQSEQDLVALATQIRSTYTQIPIFYVGESIGADMAIRLASHHRELTDGLVLSSPAIKRQSFVSPRMLADLVKLVSNPRKQLDLCPYIKECVSDDPRVTQEILADPLVRKRLSTWELALGCRTVKETLKYVRGITADVPVLIIQGSADRTVKANGVVQLITRLKSTDQTVRWLPQRGHVLLETAYLQPVALQSVSDWLSDHMEHAKPVEANAGSKGNTLTLDAHLAPVLAGSED